MMYSHNDCFSIFLYGERQSTTKRAVDAASLDQEDQQLVSFGGLEFTELTKDRFDHQGAPSGVRSASLSDEAASSRRWCASEPCEARLHTRERASHACEGAPHACEDALHPGVDRPLARQGAPHASDDALLATPCALVHVQSARQPRDTRSTTGWFGPEF